MSSQYLTLYKMIVLYMLKRCEVTLSKSQIYDFMLENEYTTFLTLQEVFAELASSELIVEKTLSNRTYLEITHAGKETLEFFGNRINPAIRNQIDEYLRTNNMKLRNESSIQGYYDRTGENEYTVTLSAKENGAELVEIRMPVPTEALAQNICDKWQGNNQEIYQYLVSVLMSE